jgi:LysR family transcriptional regulator for metE and metH
MMKIEWRHFAMLAAIRRTGSVSAAARSLGLTQSAASHQVKEAERRLGIALLARRGRSVILTQAGETLADSAAACAPLLMAAETKAQEIGHGDAPRLRLAFGLQDGMGWAPDLFAHLRDRASPLRLDLIFAGGERPPLLVQQGRADLALDIGDMALAGLKRNALGTDELVCLVGSKHRLASKKAVTAADIAPETYFAHALTPQSGFEFEGFFRPAQRVPAHVAQIETLAGILSLVAAGAGISIQPRTAITTDLLIKALPLAPRRLYLPWYVHARRGNDALLREVTAVLRPHFATSRRR